VSNGAESEIRDFSTLNRSGSPQREPSETTLAINQPEPKIVPCTSDRFNCRVCIVEMERAEGGMATCVSYNVDKLSMITFMPQNREDMWQIAMGT